MMKTYSRKKADETEEVILDINELCRLCMSKEDVLVPIFSEHDSLPLTLRIIACVALEVFEGDGLPDRICHPCKYQLEKSYLFRKKCEASDLKLRQYIKELNLRLREVDLTQSDNNGDERQDDSGNVSQVTSGDLNSSMAASEDEIVGITQVNYIHPDMEPEEDPENITLTVETQRINKEACTLQSMQMKKEVIEDDEVVFNPPGGDGMYEMSEEDFNRIQEQQQQEEEDAETQQQHHHHENQPLEDQDLEVIAEAVKSTLANHPSINCTGDIQFKIDQQDGKPTQVHVTTEDGSVIVMELSMNDIGRNNDDDDQDPHQLDHHKNLKLDNNQDEDDEEEDVINDDGELKVFKCPDCPKSFARRIQLRRHASVHMQQRGFSCGLCEKWFPTKSALIRHERIHTGERPFQCDVCQKSFAQKEILFRHLMTHTGQKPYNCPHCQRGFSQKEPLRVHLKTHINATPGDIQLHYCTLCPKVFCHASGLSRHLVTHTGKTFKCRDCDKSFTDKSSLKRHHRQTMHQD